jgi:flagellum-specific peptidoglycan hydrolase FlgJ
MLIPIILCAAFLLSSSRCRIPTPWLAPVTTTRKRWAATSPKAVWLSKLNAEARDVLECARIPPNVAFAQAALESGFGARMATNPWGVRGAGDAGSQFITTQEYFEVGKATTLSNQKFAKYTSLGAAAKGYVSFCNGKSYRPGHAFIEVDPGRWLLWLWGMGYATAPDYARSVQNVSIRVALQLDDAALAIPWSAWHDDVAQALSKVKAGSARRNLTAKLLATPLA